MSVIKTDKLNHQSMAARRATCKLATNNWQPDTPHLRSAPGKNHVSTQNPGCAGQVQIKYNIQNNPTNPQKPEKTTVVKEYFTTPPPFLIPKGSIFNIPQI